MSVGDGVMAGGYCNAERLVLGMLPAAREEILAAFRMVKLPCEPHRIIEALEDLEERGVIYEEDGVLKPRDPAAAADSYAHALKLILKDKEATAVLHGAPIVGIIRAIDEARRLRRERGILDV